MDQAATLCSDADREAVTVMLRRHALEGRLELPELEDRLGQALGARTRADLYATLHGLPETRRGATWGERLATVTRAEAVTAVITLLAVVLWSTDHLGEDAMMFAIAGAILVFVWGRIRPRRDWVQGSSAR